MKAKEIAIISAYFPPHMGGVERFTCNIARELSSRGNKVTVITSAGTSTSTSDRYENGIRVIEVPTISIMNDRFPLISPSPLSKSTIQKILSLKFDLVVINTRYYPICFLGCSLASKNKIQPVIIDHSSGYLATGNSPSDFAIRTYEKLVTSKIKRFNPAFFSVSNRGEQWLRKLEIEPHGVIPNSINVDEYIASASQRNWRKELNAQNSYLVVFAGRLIEEKGAIDVLEAFSKIEQTKPLKSVHLAIAGKGPLERHIATLSDDCNNVHFLGPLLPSDLSSLMRDADIFCYPSKYPEGLPTVLLEAAAQKTGIITSNCAGAKEVVPTPNYGIVLEKPNPQEIAQAILTMINNPEWLNECEENAFNRVSSYFSWKSTAAKVESLLR